MDQAVQSFPPHTDGGPNAGGGPCSNRPTYHCELGTTQQLSRQWSREQWLRELRGSIKAASVIDAGASHVRVGWGHHSLVNPSFIIPNFNGKKYVGSDVASLTDFSNLVLRRPHDRGYLLDIDLENTILALDSRYSAFGKKIDLLMTEPIFNPESLRLNLLEDIFEKHKFRSLLLQTPPFLSLYDYCTNHPLSSTANIPNPAVGAVVVDSGYSFTHVVPFFDQTKLSYAIKRIDVGGKLLTNYLKELVSYRHWNMMHETYLMNHVKERMCYVPLDFVKDLKNSNLRHYVLPDFVTSHLGYVKESDPVPPLPEGYKGSRPAEQVLPMNNERLIPEILFTPSDLGIRQAGIAETIVQAVEETPEPLHELLYSSIILSGGNATIPGFAERLYLTDRKQQLEQLIPSKYQTNILPVKDPHLSAWRGGAKAIQGEYFSLNGVTAKEYKERGQLYTIKRFQAL